jgi:hypothetical protein
MEKLSETRNPNIFVQIDEYNIVTRFILFITNISEIGQVFSYDLHLPDLFSPELIVQEEIHRLTNYKKVSLSQAEGQVCPIC